MSIQSSIREYKILNDHNMVSSGKQMIQNILVNWTFPSLLEIKKILIGLKKKPDISQKHIKGVVE